MFTSFSDSDASAVNLKTQKRRKKLAKLKIFHLKPTQLSYSPTTFCLHKLCSSTGLLWGREGEREQGEDLALTGERKKVFLQEGCLVMFPFAQQFRGQSACQKDKHPAQVQRVRLPLTASLHGGGWGQLSSPGLSCAESFPLQLLLTVPPPRLLMPYTAWLTTLSASACPDRKTKPANFKSLNSN